MDTHLSELNASILSTVRSVGYSPTTWKEGVNVMLEKKPGVNNVEKLRIILLFNSEFNFSNGITGRQIMKTGEEHSIIAREQYGSRKGHTAIEQALNKRLTFDLWRMERTTGALVSNDAKSCYDRIAHSVAAIAMRRMGVSKSAAETMLSTIQDLRHYIRTTFGDSAIHLDPKDVYDLVHGIGQGNAAGPAIWVAISSVLLDILREKNLGAKFTSAILKECRQVVGFALVDDTDLITSRRTGESINDVLKRMQQSVDLWEGTLRATGGALSPEKSFWYWVDF